MFLKLHGIKQKQCTGFTTRSLELATPPPTHREYCLTCVNNLIKSADDDTCKMHYKKY